MTQRKDERGISEARPYSYSSNTTRRPRKCLPADEITDLFRRVGWIGPRIRTYQEEVCWPAVLHW